MNTLGFSAPVVKQYLRIAEGMEKALDRPA